MHSLQYLIFDKEYLSVSINNYLILAIKYQLYDGVVS